jgi:predicted hydrocarbon binding protein
MDKPIIYVMTEYDRCEAVIKLREIGLGEVDPNLLYFVDAYTETAGISVCDQPNTVYADCNSLSSIDIAILKVASGLGRDGGLLIFDSLTSPYLFNGSEILRFMRQTLSKFAAQGNGVLVCVDEGCGRPEDLVAMMSFANGVVKIQTEDDKWVFDIVKHPRISHERVEIPIREDWKVSMYDEETWDQKFMYSSLEMLKGGTKGARLKGGFEEQSAVNIFWLQFALWSGMFWDPERFPIMSYEVWKEMGNMIRLMPRFVPWYWRILFRFYMPKSFSEVKHMKKMAKFLESFEQIHVGIFEYRDEDSGPDEHYIRVHENYECWGLGNLGTPLASILPSRIAGICKGMESIRGLERDWNAIEVKCIGLGDPYCEFKVVPGEIEGLRDSLRKDRSVVENVHEQLMSRLMGFLIEGKPLVERPRLGSDFAMAHPDITLAALASKRCRMALRMGGAKAGKEVGERLMEASIREGEAVNHILNFLEYCKVGRVTMADTIKIRENRESFYTKLFQKKWDEPACFFTTGFLNGFFSAVKNQHVKETKCIAMGDPYCEWELR